MSRREANLRTFIGRISSPVDNPCVENSWIVANKLVVGLVSSHGMSNFITVHHASLSLPPDAAKELAVEIAGAALGMLVRYLACRTSNCDHHAPAAVEVSRVLMEVMWSILL